MKNLLVNRTLAVKKKINFLSRLESWTEGLSSLIRPVCVGYFGSESFVPMTER